jgi:protein TonB
MRLILSFLTIAALSTNCGRQTVNDIKEVESDVTIIDPIVSQPRFPGDIEGLKQYLKKNYNWIQGQQTVEGTVYVGFLVTEDGSVCEPNIVRGLCETCDLEAIRLIKRMPKWEPAIVDGKPKTERVVLPIQFGLTNPYD